MIESLNIYMQNIKWEGGILSDNDGELINWSVMLGFLCGQLENKCGILFVPPFHYDLSLRIGKGILSLSPIKAH